MTKHRMLFIMPLIAAMALLAAFAFTTPAFAQDEVPPEEVPAEEVPAEGLAPALEEAANAGVTLVDESGEPLTLTTLDAAEALAGGDPWYKVGTRTYYFTTTDCDPGTSGDQGCADPIQAAINYIVTDTGLPSDGLIFIETGSYASSPTIDAIANPVLSGFKGLIGTVVDEAPGVSTSRIYVEGVTRGFTIKGFEIGSGAGSAAIAMYNNLGPVKIEDVDVVDSNPSGHGIEITGHNGLVTINRAKVDGNAGGGALIDNSVGTYGVIITNSSFSNNASDFTNQVGGLTLITRGAVSLTGVTAFGNTGGQPGVFVRQSGAITIKDSVFGGNAGYGFSNYYSPFPTPTGNISLTNVVVDDNARGMELYTKGAISLNGVSVSGITGNPHYGTYLDTCHENAEICDWAGTGTVTIKNSFFDNNSLTGGDASLYVNARGAISLTNVSASRISGGEGALLINRFSTITVPVKIVGGWFDDTDDLGLSIITKGTVTLSKMSASDNPANHGVLVVNTYGTTAGVAVSGLSTAYSQFTGNLGNGLSIFSNGAVSIKYVNCSDNGQGAYIASTSASVTISSSTFNDNNSTNIEAGSRGTIKLSGIEANRSKTSIGIELFNGGSVSYPGITIINTQADGNANAGFDLSSKGPIIISGGHANGNIASGVSLNNAPPADSSTYPVTLKNFTANDNTFQGINIYTRGVITLTSVTASGNQDATGAGIELFNENGALGIVLSKVTASNNAYIGIRINSFGTIKFSTVEASRNGNNGILIHTRRSITFNNVVAVDNTQFGADLVTLNAPSLAYVTITGSTGGNIFNGNGSIGLRVQAQGTVTLKNITANQNTGTGIAVLNYQAGAGLGNVTISYVNTHNNLVVGLYVDTNGNVSMSNVRSMLNQSHGVNILSHGHNVTLTSSVSIANRFSGIRAEVGATGVFTISNSLYFGNDTGINGYPNLQIIH